MTAGDDGRRGALVALALGVLAVSAAAIFVRKAGAPPLAASFWRLAIASAVLMPVAFARRERGPRGRGATATIAAGAFLGLHFGTWIASLDRTSVAASVVLVCTQPVWVAILARVVLGEATPARTWAGIGVALAGVVAIAADGAGAGNDLSGDALALGGAVAIAAYVLVGRAIRDVGIGLFMYSALVSVVGAALLLPAAIVAGEPLVGFSTATWGWLVGLALIPHVLGHTLLNQALRALPAATVSGAILAEPVVSTLLAAVFLDEVPGALTIAGGAVVLGGLWLLLSRSRRA